MDSKPIPYPQIKLRFDDKRPMNNKNYRNPHIQVKDIQDQVQKLINDGIVKRSVSEYNSPLL